MYRNIQFHFTLPLLIIFEVELFRLFSGNTDYTSCISQGVSKKTL